MGVFYNEWHLPTLWKNLNDIKLEGGKDGGNKSKNTKPARCIQGIKPQIWK